MDKYINVGKIRTTISIDTDILHLFKEYCKEMGMKLSPRIELFMRAELKNYEKQNSKSQQPED